MITEGQLLRLQYQLEPLSAWAQLTPAHWEVPTAPGKWNARLHLAHLACYQQLFMHRVRAIAAGGAGTLSRYKAEEDPAWAAWQLKPIKNLVEEIQADRDALLIQLRALAPHEQAATATHALLGEMHLGGWVEFFLLHEAHHLLTVLKMVRAGRL